jgi:Zn-dependent alcohol dehydrogenase
VLLGGGLLRAGDGLLLCAIEAGLGDLGKQIEVRRATSPPVVGAALFGLDALGAGEEAGARVRAELGAAVDFNSSSPGEEIAGDG